MRLLTAKEVHSRKISELGISRAAENLTSVEAIAAALRRAAGFLCPCSKATLVRKVVNPLRGLAEDNETVTKNIVEKTLDAMICYGDILENWDLEDDSGHLVLYPAPASFVFRKSGTVFLLGIASEQSLLPDYIEGQIQYVRHMRYLSLPEEEDIAADLKQYGLVEISDDQWLKVPGQESAEQHLSRLNELLNLQKPSREVPGLSFLDTERSVDYYRGRWINEVCSQSGRFVARRKQAYGADIWCYVEIIDGNPERIIDLPVQGKDNSWRGCDEAWHLQMAIDSVCGNPQLFRVCADSPNTCIIEFFSPVPMWARRRWDVIGEPAESAKGSNFLFGYSFAKTELDQELSFIRDRLWLKEME